MGTTAIIVDGSDRPLVGTTVVVPPARVERGGRRWAALGIGILTAVIAIGATGPAAPRQRAAEEGTTAVARAADLADRQPLPWVATMDRNAVPAPWIVWVDPHTGATVRTARTAAELRRRVQGRPAPGCSW